MTYPHPALSRISLAAAAAILLLTPLSAIAAGEVVPSGGLAVANSPVDDSVAVDQPIEGGAYAVQQCTDNATYCRVNQGQNSVGWVNGSLLFGAQPAVPTPNYGPPIVPNY
ncbi:MAG: hypothetical protein JWQ89_4244 [Devosia sp.]|uniref:hypothetical protein n=1 Tax=Devosia sp. TaxID=1871048 RepID=UPI00262C45B7|nr:hypothetical protein [Devosia sp.]MDB5542517.1 hypothetical protein [Devosia sp.]